MKYILAVLLVGHGLIHLLGFLKAFGLAQLPQLQISISRSTGLLWAITALLLLTSGGMVLASVEWWWAPAGLGILLSQVLIFSAWSDAKAGSIVNIILSVPILVAALGSAPWSFRAMYDRDVAAGLSQAPQEIKLLTQADMAHLPAIVQRYLVFTGSVGKPEVWNYRLKLGGSMRNGVNNPWMSMMVDQQSFVDPPARLFHIEASMFGVPFTAFHRYVGPEATFRVRVASLVPMVDARGPEMNRSETVTLLNDMFLLAPSTLIDPAIVWQELDPLTVRATWTNAGNTVSAIVSFDDSGALANFVSDDRYMSADGKTFEQHRWSTPVSDWRLFDGRRLPATGEATWDLPGGKYTYLRYEILAAQYNVPAQ